ncbi:MAG: hypothetical protein KUG78_00555 [Kangiellaceae bacterium]|nr:hypothetical protein [Kangiellaceae bacterium]
MSPTNKSLLAVAASGLLFTILLSINPFASSQSTSGDFSSPELAAEQIADDLASNVTELANGLAKLSNNSYWQNALESDWSLNLSTHSDIYKAAGLSLLAVHSQSSNQLYTRLGKQNSSNFDLSQALARVYKNSRSLRVLQTYEQQPAIFLIEPIRSIENKIIGNLIGIKLIDTELLKQYHYLAKSPVATFKNAAVNTISSESIPDLNQFKQINIEWPRQIESDKWSLTLLSKESVEMGGITTVLIVGLLITLATLFIVWQQIQRVQNSLKSLNKTMNIELPIVEQIKRLTAVQNSGNDMALLECAQAVRTRLEQLSQQKKSLALEVRKLQESQEKLKRVKSNIESERDSAVAAPRLKSEFLSRMGDEITTPMKSVVSMLKLLSEYPFEPEPKQLLTIAKRSTRTLVNNLNNILDFSKLDANMLRLKPKQFSVRSAIDELSSELSHFANEKGLSLQASSTPEMPELLNADEYRIKQILRNLLGNAIRFTKGGEVSLYADLTAKGGNKLLRFTIADTGIGITPAAQKELFDSLEQTTKLSNSSFTGRLRLIVSKHLAELMGGEIGVISEIGQGSQFWFTVAYTE